MSRRYIVAMSRVVLWIVLAVLIALVVRDYLLPLWTVSIPPRIFGMFTLVLIWFLAWRPFRRIIDMQREYALARQARTPLSHPSSPAKTYEGQVHRYPFRVILLTLIGDLVLLSLPYLSAWPDKAIAPATYFICFGAACGVTVLLVYILIYRVTIESDRVVIRAFETCDIRFDDIVRTDAVTPISVPPVVPRCLLLLTDGTEVKLNGMLTGFSDLVDALKANARSSS
jgi:hypothetical protein